MDEIEGERHDYQMLKQNSNSLVDTVLSRVGSLCHRTIMRRMMSSKAG